MRSVNERVLSGVLIITIILSFFAFLSTSVKAKEICINIETAKKIAIFKIQYYIANNEKDELSKWRWGEYIEEPIPMYSLDGNVEAYYVSVINEKKESAGYVIVGANKSHAPVIEFGVFNEFYPAVAMKKIEGDRLYYLGSVCYMVGKDDHIVDATSFGELKKVDIDSVKKNGVIREDYSNAWDYWEKQLETKHISIKDNRIEEPSYKAELVKRGNSRDVTGYNLAYKVMDSFPGETNHCLPLAGINLFIYWTNRSSSYASLRQYNDQFWKKTFRILKTDMQTDPIDGTNPDKGEEGFKTYFRRCYIRNYVEYNENADYLFCKYEINANRPIIIDYLYDPFYRHAVLGLGYSYDDVFNVRVADGYSGYAGRYYAISSFLGVFKIEFY